MNAPFGCGFRSRLSGSNGAGIPHRVAACTLGGWSANVCGGHGRIAIIQRSATIAAERGQIAVPDAALEL
jgi:hypothetical protein